MNAADVIWMVVSVVLFERLDAHAEEAGDLPQIDASLHEPSRGGVPKRVRCYAGQAKLFGCPLEGEPNSLDWLAPDFHRIASAQPTPAPHMCKQARRYPHRWPALFCFRSAGGTAIEHAVIEVDIRSSRLRLKGRGSDYVRAAAGVKANEEESRQVPPGESLGRLAEFDLASAPRLPDHLRGLRSCQPSISRRTTIRLDHLNKAVVQSLSQMMVYGSLKDHKIRARHRVRGLLASVRATQRPIYICERPVGKECAQARYSSDGRGRVRVLRNNVFSIKGQNVSDGDFVRLARSGPSDSRVFPTDISG